MPLAFWSQSGGVIYHLRALWYRTSYWSSTQRWLESVVGDFLDALDTRGTSSTQPIWVIGSSGLYLWSDSLLSRTIARGPIFMNDIDPAASFFARLNHRRVFNRRHSHPLDWVHKDLIGSWRGRPEVLRAWLIEQAAQGLRPAGILWNGVLAQLTLEGWSSAEIAQIWHEFQREAIPQLSVHDLWVLPSQYKWKKNMPGSIAQGATIHQILHELSEKNSILTPEINIEQFDSVGWCNAWGATESPRGLNLWPLTPERIHVLQSFSSQS
jgi:hypothetical protein